MTKIKSILIIGLSLIIFSSCSLFNKLSAPHYNAITYGLAVSADSTMNAMYAGFSNGSDLGYAANSSTYDAVENIINQKIGIDSSRKYPTQILAIDHTYLDEVEMARKDHEQDGNITANHISVNGALIRQIGHILVTTEKTYK